MAELGSPLKDPDAVATLKAQLDPESSGSVPLSRFLVWWRS